MKLELEKYQSYVVALTNSIPLLPLSNIHTSPLEQSPDRAMLTTVENTNQKQATKHFVSSVVILERSDLPTGKGTGAVSAIQLPEMSTNDNESVPKISGRCAEEKSV
jgi:glucosamine 6-phosphate synthetase-like amidotransferase/phosphosugar isomerase protein